MKSCGPLPRLSLMTNLSSLDRKGDTFTNLCPTLSQLFSAQSNPYAKVVYFRVAK